MAMLASLLADYLRHQLEETSASPPPAGGELIWKWFCDLSRTRTYHGYGPNPISHGEISAYAQLYGWPIEPRHVDLILHLDGMWMEAARDRLTNGAGGGGRPSQPITAEAFDAVFS